MQLLTIVLIYFVALAQAARSNGIIPFTITSPREHQTWVIGQEVSMVWKTHGIPAGSTGEILLGNTKGGETLHYLAKNVNLAKGRATVKVPNVNHPGDGFWVAGLGRTHDNIPVGGTDGAVDIKIKRGH